MILVVAAGICPWGKMTTDPHTLSLCQVRGSLSARWKRREKPGYGSRGPLCTISAISRVSYCFKWQETRGARSLPRGETERRCETRCETRSVLALTRPRDPRSSQGGGGAAGRRGCVPARGWSPPGGGPRAEVQPRPRGAPGARGGGQSSRRSGRRAARGCDLPSPRAPRRSPRRAMQSLNLTAERLSRLLRDHNLTRQRFIALYGLRPLVHTPRLPGRAQLALALAGGLIFLLALVGNALVLCAVARGKATRTVTNVFIGSLALSDLLVAFFCIPVTVLQNVSDTWLGGECARRPRSAPRTSPRLALPAQPARPSSLAGGVRGLPEALVGRRELALWSLHFPHLLGCQLPIFI